MTEKIIKRNSRKKMGNAKKVRWPGIFLACLLTGSLAACTDSIPSGGGAETPTIIETKTEKQSVEKEKQPVETQKQSEEAQSQTTVPAIMEVQTDRLEETVSQSTQTAQEKLENQTTPASVGSSDGTAMKEAYASVLKDILENQKFPDGQEYGYDGNDLADNKFAVYDIDADGRDELIILYTTTYTAGMAELIYDFDSQSGTVRQQFCEFPSNRHYDNGIVESDASHNQGLAGRFWPYTMYQYDKETDSYKVVAMVDAWDKSLRETDYNGIPFPDEVDKNGDLLIYYIIPEGNNSADPVDQEEYDQWWNSQVGEANLLNIPYMSLTEENINSLAMQD